MKNLSKTIACLLFIFIGTNAYSENEFSFEEIKLLAEKGEAGAQNNLGLIYYAGKGVTQNFKEALKWFNKSAEQKDAAAQYNLGILYEEGKGVNQSNEKAVNWYAKSAEQGYVLAKYNLGVMYSAGKGTPKDDKKAFKLYQEAAEQGHVKAQYNLGVKYGKGEGVTQSFYNCYLWSILAKINGESKAIELKNICASLLSKTELAKAQKKSAEMLERIQANKK